MRRRVHGRSAIGGPSLSSKRLSTSPRNMPSHRRTARLTFSTGTFVIATALQPHDFTAALRGARVGR
jgi:hypothetical protein